ncbi:MAG: hypothetical protein K8M05_32095 [Deltaproteobacteria bacterium]|nr:hypothetical protein [Kofleriaceae bacterium]
MSATVINEPRVARVRILWSENGAVPVRSFQSLAGADAALDTAFQKEPPPEGGAYDKTAFEVVWTDGERHEGRADVRRIDLHTAPEAGGILRQHLNYVGRWLRDRSSTSAMWTPEEAAERKAWGEELLRRLDREPTFGKIGRARNLDHIPEDQLLPLGATSDQVDVSLLPDPAAAVAELEAHFAAIRPPVPVWMGHGRTVPRATNEDVTYAANWLSLALAHDMPRLRAQTGRPQGAVWDRWAKTVEHVRRHLGTDPDATYRDNQRFWSDQVPHMAHKIESALHGAGPRNSAAPERRRRTA